MVWQLKPDRYLSSLAGGPSGRRFSKWYCSDLDNLIEGRYKRIGARSEQRDIFP